jgi:cell division protein ZapD
LGQNRGMSTDTSAPAAGSRGAEAIAESDVSILYEYPLNERIRTLLRLEDLFERLELFAAREHPADHHMALLTIFEILDVTTRGDLRSDLLQELERQRTTLNTFRNNPAVSVQALERTMARVDAATTALGAMSGRVGQHLRDNEWLMSIRSRTGIAGGACEFDLPSYHAWQHRSLDIRRQDLFSWVAPLRPLHFALAVVLSLLRDSGAPQALVSQQGSYQQQMGGKTFQMVQIRLDRSQGAIPEISANKYLFWVRFMSQDGDLRPRPFDGEVAFVLSLCNL